jgi:hypothetical protein
MIAPYRVLEMKIQRATPTARARIKTKNLKKGYDNPIPGIGTENERGSGILVW